jgi:hypothetical protein
MPLAIDPIAWLKHETACCIHLAKSLQDAQLGFRFTAPQRSTLELLRYLAIANEGLLSFIIDGTWDRWEVLEGQVKDLDLAGFPAAMQAQQRRVAKLLSGLKPSQLKAVIAMPNGTKSTRAAAIEHYLLKMSVGYKMQLFLQAKAAGAAQLASSDLWNAKAPKPKKG